MVSHVSMFVWKQNHQTSFKDVFQLSQVLQFSSSDPESQRVCRQESTFTFRGDLNQRVSKCAAFILKADVLRAVLLTVELLSSWRLFASCVNVCSYTSSDVEVWPVLHVRSSTCAAGGGAYMMSHQWETTAVFSACPTHQHQIHSLCKLVWLVSNEHR